MSKYSLPTIEAGAALTDGYTLIDVRRRKAAEEVGTKVSGATYVEPESLSLNHPVLDLDRLCFYCVHGHEVSHYAVALALVARREAVLVTGGFDALVAAGAKLEDLA
jgi:Fe-Mn family superoxide dismutase